MGAVWWFMLSSILGTGTSTWYWMPPCWQHRWRWGSISFMTVNLDLLLWVPFLAPMTHLMASTWMWCDPFSILLCTLQMRKQTSIRIWRRGTPSSLTLRSCPTHHWSSWCQIHHLHRRAHHLHRRAECLARGTGEVSFVLKWYPGDEGMHEVEGMVTILEGFGKVSCLFKGWWEGVLRHIWSYGLLGQMSFYYIDLACIYFMAYMSSYDSWRLVICILFCLVVLTSLSWLWLSVLLDMVCRFICYYYGYPIYIYKIWWLR